MAKPPAFPVYSRRRSVVWPDWDCIKLGMPANKNIVSTVTYYLGFGIPMYWLADPRFLQCLIWTGQSKRRLEYIFGVWAWGLGN